MSQSSSAGSSSHGGGGAGYDGRGSPVPYRVGPLAYEPAVLCNCQMKACRWISWSEAQPGRRYYRCRKWRTPGACNFYQWHDEESSDWYKELLRDLRDAVWKVKTDLARKEAEVEAKSNQLVVLQMELEEKKKELEERQLLVEVKQQVVHGMEEELIAKQQQLEAKDGALVAMQAKLKSKNQCIDALVLLCVLLLIILVVVLLHAK